MKTNNNQISKFLSLILRHTPDKIGIQLDENGWVDVSELLHKIKKYQPTLNLKLLKEIVATNDKKRFAFNEDMTKIRASQGHSVSVELAYEAKQPPAFLYHGTVAKFMSAIKENGLLKMNRHHVHLSEDRITATRVGERRGKPIILTVRSGEMHAQGAAFFQSENGVWLTDHVLPEYIEF
ncbi:RNA 2'-phosphotransferase [Aquimarina pacifica]|uniref:RNA 2'-phosphotransferase n=1 Tax=Aquimarina pacifica TaxID=1296415 RepID=UPI00046F19ED|nr:RNA 2'-phosphotransferase [Aquimarina pacifica]